MKFITKILTMFAFIGMIAAIMAVAQNGEEAQKSNKFKIDELAFLPHPGKLIKGGKVVITEAQKKRFVKEIKSVYPPLFQEKMREAFKLERQLRKAVQQGKTKKELSVLLDSIAKLKREAMDGRIDALNHLQKIMDEEQWNAVFQLTYQ